MLHTILTWVLVYVVGCCILCGLVMTWAAWYSKTHPIDSVGKNFWTKKQVLYMSTEPEKKKEAA